MSVEFDKIIEIFRKIDNPTMIGKLNQSPFGEWWVHFHDGKSLQRIDESIDTSSFKYADEIHFEIHLASNPELTEKSANKYRAFLI